MRCATPLRLMLKMCEILKGVWERFKQRSGTVGAPLSLPPPQGIAHAGSSSANSPGEVLSLGREEENSGFRKSSSLLARMLREMPSASKRLKM
eukprot:1672020-Amphidinium_carterae.1